MNIKQHFFIYVGIMLITFMAIMIDSTLLWLVAAMVLISESVWLCKNKSIESRELFFLCLSIVIFVILFISSHEIKNKVESAIGIRFNGTTPKKIIR